MTSEIKRPYIFPIVFGFTKATVPNIQIPETGTSRDKQIHQAVKLSASLASLWEIFGHFGKFLLQQK